MLMILYYMELVGVTLIVGAVLSLFSLILSAIAFKIASYFEKDD